jgi:hypothetical protein
VLILVSGGPNIGVLDIAEVDIDLREVLLLLSEWL